ncbi:hypothetical protein [Streptomyces erythrochromogenes]|uniref:hypothetical protein n=1 Tax=Streptomyces erythrochromogenes TaxID=285574 RepID=UPI003702D495
MTETVIDLATGIYERQAQEWETYEYEAACLAETQPYEEPTNPQQVPMGYLVPEPLAAARPWESQPEKYRRLMQPR